ncbi:MAG: hypothetical protein LC792_14530, partial [Actinobacteria bacterium]|nr:hypothetical protein [Actinomycetota bacterium]
TQTHSERRDGRRNALDARTPSGLKAILRRARGWTCDVRAVALDDQSGTLHVPLIVRNDRRSPAGRSAAGELIVRRVEEFLIEGPARARWFDFEGLAYEPATRRVSIGSDGRSHFALTVEALDITLRIRPQTRPHS